MNFDLTEEQQILKQSVKRFLEKEIKPCADEYTEKLIPKDMAHDLIKKLIPFGYVVGPFPEEIGGMNMDTISQGILFEELFRVFPGLGGIAFITMDTALTLYEYGTKEQIDRFIPKLLSGDYIGCVAVTEPDIGSNPSEVKTRGILEGENYRVNGQKIWISNGSVSDVCVVLVRTEKDPGKKSVSRLIVERSVSDYSSRDLGKLGLNSWPTSELFFDDTLVPKENLLGDVGEGLKSTLRTFERARCFVALYSIGIAQASVDATIQYVKEREQWGKPIGQHQMIQDMLADMLIELDAAKLLTYRGLYLIGKGARCDTQTSMAKYYATEAAVKITSNAIQIHGGYGLSKEFPIERLFRDARMLTIPDGTSQIQKLIVARNTLGLAAFK
ncbi:acyl-CoA dehydrogenase family protein [Alkalihalobacterium alkalinitrilicum]|uniref:acyl-CoA dehydrogenase family protein n=1 Tax=Alkalihalobacterium alkalinitrilicum TaxID=427920 RepID=UPI000995DCA9|nr:acyl-CoA dehydrogenase family protein [Alkalihalobacterium alkalinitrilicum]